MLNREVFIYLIFLLQMVKYLLNIMLTNLTIQNFGLIDRITVNFDKGLNILTGETGAGKSILIDALQAALGGKLTSSHIRDKKNPCVIEAVFEFSPGFLKDHPALSEHMHPDEPSFIINRSFSPDGRGKNKINGFSVTVAQLKDIGNDLVDIHGPHDHQMLLSENSHLAILDRLSSIEKEKAEYSGIFSIYTELTEELEALKDLSKNSEREIDMLTHQIKEMEQVSLSQEEYETLITESSKINNSEKLHSSAAALLELIDNEESGITRASLQAFTFMNTLTATDGSALPFAEILSRIQDDSSELASALMDYIGSLSFDRDQAEDINRRIDLYYDLTRKYGSSLEDVRLFYSEAKKKHALLTDLEHNDAELKKRIGRTRQELDKAAAVLTEKRKRTAAGLKTTIESELKELGIKQVKFKCRIEPAPASRSGQDKVSFYISPNAGEDLKPMAEIVSSGEAARVMLALKKALTKADPVPVLVFDEIDAQIGGRLGSVTGKKLKELSTDRQVILITHLPQIASFGTIHHKVSKTVRNGRTFTEIESLGHKERVKELSEMMSGEVESGIAVKHAEDMLRQAEKLNIY